MLNKTKFLNINKFFLIYFIVHILLVAILFKSKLIMFGTNDEIVLLQMLKEGYGGTLILSYPMSIFIAFFYKNFPSFQWLSLFYFLIATLNIIIFYIYFLNKNKETYNKIFILLFSIIIYVYAWQNLGITLLTLLLFISVVITIRYNPYLAFLFLTLAFFLRYDIALLCFPFIFFTLFIIDKKLLFKKNNLILLVISLIIPIFIQNSMVKDDIQYKNWLEYNNARATFHDLKGDKERTNFTIEEKQILGTWLIQDEYLLASEKLIANNYSKIELYLEKLNNYNYKSILKYRYKYIIGFIFIITLIVIYKNRSKLDLIAYLLLGFGFLILIILRDVDRVVIPLIFLSVVLYIVLSNNKNIYNYIILTSIILFLLKSIPIKYYSDIKPYEKKLELLNYLKLNTKYNCEIALGFPQEWNSISYIINSNFIFDESNIVSKNEILASGWTARHPFFYKTHNISAYGQERKYNSFYDWLISEESCFIGGDIIENNFSKMVLDMYDLKLENKSCKHKVKIIDSYKDLKVTKIYINCKEKNK